MALPPSNGKIVLVSGINGFIASRIGLDLLKEGYTLRGALRNYNYADALVNGAYRDFRGRVQLVIVSDMTADGAFDEAVKGVTAVIHTASPIRINLTSWDHSVRPAVNGSLSILNSAFNHAGPQLESFVFTSSVAAVQEPFKKPYEFTEADWNEWAEPLARDGNTAALYPASKTLAERAIWKFCDENKPKFSISAVNPGVVIGPLVQPPIDPNDLNMTIKPIWTIFLGGGARARSLPNPIGTASYIDVRDVSAMHIWCVENPSQSNGERYLMSDGCAPPQAVADVLREKHPARRDRIPVGKPGEGYEAGYSWPKGGISIRNTKAKRALGKEDFIGFEQSVLDTVEVFERVYRPYLEDDE